ncbi:RDD family protein [uncultured Stenotrophomonas sp.]|uniref:RDD family protein n=1 Tax=uncultured Stenotrophomonas sp. TaxID=165438 RepID=UPI0028EDE5DC|nr:RDD family protein [uncultured Stenotrophomonas sp.]
MSTPTVAAADTPRPSALLHWRLLALVYDFFPALALWMLAGALFTAGYAVGHATRDNIAPFSALQWALWACCWLVTGLYATMSWRRGGQTLGMRPWRLQVVGADGSVPTARQLWIRYAVGTVSIALGGLGFWWALVDRERLTWHDRASGTQLRRNPKR